MTENLAKTLLNFLSFGKLRFLPRFQFLSPSLWQTLCASLALAVLVARRGKVFACSSPASPPNQRQTKIFINYRYLKIKVKRYQAALAANHLGASKHAIKSDALFRTISHALFQSIVGLHNRPINKPQYFSERVTECVTQKLSAESPYERVVLAAQRSPLP